MYKVLRLRNISVALLFFSGIIIVMKQNKNNHKWSFVALIAVLLAVPNATVIKVAVENIDPALFITIKAALVSIVLAPYILVKRAQISRQALKSAVFSGFFMSISTVSYAFAIEASKASYALMLMLLVPVISVLYAVRFDGKTVSHRSYAGMSLAAAGAFCIVGLPIVWRQEAGAGFYPLATALMVLVVLSFPLTVIFSKRAHQDGAPLAAVQGISSMVVFVCALTVSLFTVEAFSGIDTSATTIFAIVYSALAVSFAARALSVAAYERINVALYSSLGYLEILMAVTLPIILLGEKLSREMVIGGILILVGVYAVEHHKLSLDKHHQPLKDH